MTFKFGTRSIANLVGVHPDLVRVMTEAITNSPHDFTIIEGVRSLNRQKMLLNAGSSRTLNSRHITGHAVDIAIIKGGVAKWDVQFFEETILHIEAVSKLNGVPLMFGGRWKTLVDWPHIELDRKIYP